MLLTIAFFSAVLVTLATAGAGYALVRAGLRHRAGVEPHCGACGYCLVDLTGRRCPECGQDFTYFDLPEAVRAGVIVQGHRSPSYGRIALGAGLLAAAGLWMPLLALVLGLRR